MPQGAYLPRTFCQRCGLNVPIYRKYMRGLPRLFWNLTIIGLFAFRAPKWYCTKCNHQVRTPSGLLTQGQKDNKRLGKAVGREVRRDIRKLFK